MTGAEAADAKAYSREHYSVLAGATEGEQVVQCHECRGLSGPLEETDIVRSKAEAARRYAAHANGRHMEPW